MYPNASPSRRTLLAGLGALPAAPVLASLLGPEARAERPALDLADSPRTLSPTGSDLGSLYAQVAKLADPPHYALSFLGDRFRDVEAFKAEARPRLFDLLAYRPARVDPRPEVIERIERNGYVREK